MKLKGGASGCDVMSVLLKNAFLVKSGYAFEQLSKV